MPDFQLNYSGEQVNAAIGNGLNAITTESGQVLTTNQQQVVQQKIGLPELFSHTAPPIIETVNGSVVSVTDASDQSAVSLISHIEPVQEGEGDPSQNNVRPISGWDAVKAPRAGKNIAPDVYSDYFITSIYAVYTVNPQGLPIVMSLTDKDTTVDVSGVSIGLIDDANNPSGNYKWCLSSGVLQNPIVAQTYRNIFVYPKTEATFNKIFSRYNVQVEFGTTATAYEPYQGQILTAELPETVYGGSLDWATGVLQPEYKKTVFDGDENWKMYSTSNGNGFYIELEGFVDSQRQVLSDKLKFIGEFGGGSSFLAAANVGECCVLTGSPRFYVKSDATTVDEFKAYLASNPVTVVHSCNTMQPIQLTPQQLDMLKGTNNVWSDTGDTELSYVADTKLYINKQIASIATTAQNT